MNEFEWSRAGLARTIFACIGWKGSYVRTIPRNVVSAANALKPAPHRSRRPWSESEAGTFDSPYGERGGCLARQSASGQRSQELCG